MILTNQEKRVLVDMYSHPSETYFVAGCHYEAATRALSALNLLYIDEEVQIGSNTQQPVLRVSKSRNGQKEYDKIGPDGNARVDASEWLPGDGS